MQRKVLLLSLGVTVCLAVFLLKLKADNGEDHGPTVRVSVQATDTSRAPLHYQWRSTDGVIQNVDSSITTWTLPPGPGLHFAYVLVSNGLGGYTERRIAVNTDTIGTEQEQQQEREDEYARLVAPPGPAQVGDYYRSFVILGQDGTADNPQIIRDVYEPDLAAYLQDRVTLARYPSAGTVKSDEKGQVLVAGVPPGSNYIMNCSVDGGVSSQDCTGGANAPPAVMESTATSDYLSGFVQVQVQPITGSLKLQDGSPCGTFNEFFGVHVTGTAVLLDRGGKVVSGPVRVNEFGDYAIPIPRGADGVTVLLKCENAAITVPPPPSTIVLPAGTDLSKTVLTGVKAPTVSGMTATLHGQLLAPPIAIFLPPPTGFPSDIMPRSDGYLASKGLDSRLGACQYYKAVGAVKSCDSAGNLVGAITFRDWRHAVKIGKFATGGVPTLTAAFINKVDLNLARVHESISYGPNKTAGVVCNHLGPPGGTPHELINPSQADIDAAVANAIANKNLVACVAMDYAVGPGVNGNQPFIRFLIFGPSGELLPSINLDGRREKFVPGTCVVCHGGDHYAGKFPEDGSGFANVGGHFLPYDTGNFEFSSKPGLREADQELAIYHLNQNVLKAGPTQAEKDLIAGWYAHGTTLDKDFTPPSWLATNQATAIDFYRKVMARSCRTCHVAMIDGYNFDKFENAVPGGQTKRFADIGFDIGINICGGSRHFVRDHMMPNSLITFNRFWLSSGTANDQPFLLTQFYGSDTGSSDAGGCPPPAGTLP
jgi:hypothetical protein